MFPLNNDDEMLLQKKSKNLESSARKEFLTMCKLKSDAR